jgi:iron complex outermembrane receptor protein
MRTSIKVTTPVWILMAAHILCAPAARAQGTPDTSAPAQAHTSAGAGSGPSEEAQLVEIVVTAQKRQQSINSVGMAITAVASAQLKQENINSVADLTKVDPSFIASQNLWGAPVYTIRGIGYNDFALAASPTVSVYVDEVPYAYSALTKGATLDVERVEILKGPQGTLYGQNATGGAVNYIAARPTSTFEAGIEGTYSRFNSVNLDGYVSGPLTSKLNARLSFELDEGGAWQHSYTRDDTLGNRDNKKARLLLDWTPTNKLKVSVNLNGWTDNSDTQAAQEVGVALGRPAAAAFVPDTVNEAPSPHNAQAADWLAGTHPKDDEGFYQGSVRADYTVSDNLLFTYLGSYENYSENDLTQDNGLNDPTYLYQIGTVDSTSHELRASGKLFDDKVDWLIGGDYTKTKANENQFQYTLGTTTAYSLTQLPLALHEPAIPPYSGFKNISRDTSIGKAIFENLEYHPIKSLGLHAGARYTETDINHGGCTQDVDGNAAAGITALETIIKHGVGVVPALPGQCFTLGPNLTPGWVQGQLDQPNISWRFGADWTPIEKTLLYATVSKGYKAGNFPTLAASDYLSLKPVTQESLVAYEVGVKSRLADNRVEVDGAVFHYNYRDKQLEARQPDPQGIFGFLNGLVNVPRSREDGAELTVKVRPMSGLSLSASGTYLDSRVSEKFINYNPFINTPLNLEGEAFPNTPKWSFGLGSRYEWDVSGRYSAYVGMDARYQSKTQGAFGADSSIQEGFPSLLIKGYGVLDLQAGLESDDGHWRFGVFVNNATNTYYWTQAIRNSDNVVRYAGLPATYGVKVGYKY